MRRISVDDVITSYNRFVPHQILNLMGKDNVMDVNLGDSLETNMTILFSDMRDFTKLSESMTPHQNFQFINSSLERMEPVIGSSNGIIDKYIGDAIMALFPTTANDAVDATIGMLGRLSIFNQERKKAGEPPSPSA